jgi:hypothetical protein
LAPECAVVVQLACRPRFRGDAVRKYAFEVMGL